MIGDRLRLLRENIGKEQYYIANIINVARNTYTGYETNKTTPTIETLCTLALFYNTSLDYILGLSKSKKPYNKMRKYNKQTFRRNIKLIRHKLNYTQKLLAEQISCHRVTVARYENGQAEIQIDFLIKLSKLSKIPSDFIVGIITN